MTEIPVPRPPRAPLIRRKKGRLAAQYLQVDFTPITTFLGERDQLTLPKASVLPTMLPPLLGGELPPPNRLSIRSVKETTDTAMRQI